MAATSTSPLVTLLLLLLVLTNLAILGLLATLIHWFRHMVDTEEYPPVGHWAIRVTT